jgi:uncharacterized protein (TIGR02301 family)
MAAGIACAIVFTAAPDILAQDDGNNGGTDREASRPYDKDLLQLAEVLGAIHYLRALCGADEGQKWRDQMRGLIESEGTSPLRRARLVRSFNKGYRGYGRTYRRCTELARISIKRLVREGQTLAKSMLDAAG